MSLNSIQKQLIEPNLSTKNLMWESNLTHGRNMETSHGFLRSQIRFVSEGFEVGNKSQTLIIWLILKWLLFNSYSNYVSHKRLSELQNSKDNASTLLYKWKQVPICSHVTILLAFAHNIFQKKKRTMYFSIGYYSWLIINLSILNSWN